MYLANTLRAAIPDPLPLWRYRRNFCKEAKTSATVSLYRRTSLLVERAFGRSFLYVGLIRLDEKESVLSRRLSSAIGFFFLNSPPPPKFAPLTFRNAFRI